MFAAVGAAFGLTKDDRARGVCGGPTDDIRFMSLIRDQPLKKKLPSAYSCFKIILFIFDALIERRIRLYSPRVYRCFVRRNITRRDI